MTRTRRIRHLTVAATAVTAAASWMVSTRAAGVHLGVRFPHAPSATTVALGPTIGAAATAALAGWAVLALVEHRAGRPRRTWIALALTAFLASLALPAAFATTAAAALALACMHLAVAVVVVAGLGLTAAPSLIESAAAAPPRRLVDQAA